MRRLYALLIPLVLVSCIAERIITPGGGVNPPENDGEKLTITIPGGFSIASTRAGQTRAARATRAAEEDAIRDLYILTFTDDVLADIHEVAIATDISPVEDTDNQYSITNWTIPTGDHRIVMLANTADLGSASSGIAIGDNIWARSNLDTYRTFAAGETSYGRLFQFGSAAMPAASKVAWPGNVNPTAVTAANPGVRWSDGANVSPYNFPGANWSASGGWAAENNPCPVGWSVPTWDQWQNLLDTTTDNTAGDTIDGIPGRKFVSDADPDVYLFLPGTGYRYQNYDSPTPSNGYYWSSTAGGGTTGYNLYFYNGIATLRNNNVVRHSFGIRCVTSVPGVVADVSTGQTYAAVRGLFEIGIEGKMYETDGHVPMWGEAATVAGDPQSISVSLRRSIARIDVGAGAFDEDSGTWAGLGNFAMTSVTLIAPNDKYAVIPVLDADGVPLAPSVPASAAAFSLADSQSLFTWSGTSTAAEIYVPEAEITDVAHGSRMALVIGGRYSTDADPSYYRVDFKRNDGTLLDVLRNHLYLFSIASVSGRGLPDVETAYNSTRSQMNVTVVGWGEVEFPTEL